VSHSIRRFIYGITIWQERPTFSHRPAAWRFSVEDARTGLVHPCRSLKAVITFLRQRMENDKSEGSP
jgi:hypothetical protein